MRHRLPVLTGVLSCLTVTIPWFEPTRRHFEISGLWNNPSNFYFVALLLACLGLVTSYRTRSPQRGWRVGGRILSWSGLTLAAASLVLAAVSSLAMLS